MNPKILTLQNYSKFEVKYTDPALALMDVLGVFTSENSFRTPKNRHQRRPRTSKIVSVRPDSKGTSYIPISFRMVNSCQNVYQMHFLIPVTLTVEQ